eukprot:10164-Heterococcus_DN1.PRE.4
MQNGTQFVFICARQSIESLAAQLLIRSYSGCADSSRSADAATNFCTDVDAAGTIVSCSKATDSAGTDTALTRHVADEKAGYSTAAVVAAATASIARMRSSSAGQCLV